MKEVPNRLKQILTSISAVILIVGYIPSVAASWPRPEVDQISQNQYEEACEYLSQKNYPKAIELLQNLLAHHLERKFSFSPLDEIFPLGGNSPYLRLIDEHPDDIQGIVALNKVVLTYREQRKSDLVHLSHLLVCLKHAGTETCSYAKEEFVREHVVSSLKRLKEEDKRHLDVLGKNLNSSAGVEALRQLANSFAREGKETAYLYLYVTLAHPNTQVSRAAQVMLADIHYQQGDYPQALNEYKSVIEVDSEDSAASSAQEAIQKIRSHLAESADLYYQQGKYEQALNTYQRLIQHQAKGPKAASFESKLAFCLYKLKRFDEAIRICENLAKNYPQDRLAPLSLEMVAKIQHEQRNFDGGFATWQRIKRFYPNYKITDADLAELLAAKEREAAEEVVSLRMEIDEFPDLDRGVSALDKLLLLLGKDEEKRKHLCEDILSKHQGTRKISGIR